MGKLINVINKRVETVEELEAIIELIITSVMRVIIGIAMIAFVGVASYLIFENTIITVIVASFGFIAVGKSILDDF